MYFRALLVGALFVGLLGVAAAQPDPGKFGPLASAPEFSAASYYAENRFFAKAIAEYERVATTNLGTPLEATARLLLANIRIQALSTTAIPDPGAEIQRIHAELDLVIDRFPGTSYWFVARWMKAQAIEDAALRRASLDQLISEVGGRPFAQILDDQPDPDFHESMVSAEFRADLSEIYETEAYALPDLDRARIMVFIRESFPHTTSRTEPMEYFKRKLRAPAMTHDGEPPGQPTPDTVPPAIVARSPEPGAATNSQATLEIIIADGDFWQNQVSTRQTRLFLDGADVSSQVRWASDIDGSGARQNFEEITLTYRPPALDPGTHTIEVLLSDNGGNSNRESWQFLVQNAPVGDLSISSNAISKHVKPHKGEKAIIRVSSNHKPMRYQIFVKRKNQTVFTLNNIQSLDGNYEFRWDGSGTGVSNGNHEVVIVGYDSLGRSAIIETPVQVNLNGKDHSWKSLFQVALHNGSFARLVANVVSPSSALLERLELHPFAWGRRMVASRLLIQNLR